VSVGAGLPAEWRRGEVAVVGLARSGVAACRLLRARGCAVYGSDLKDPAAADTRERERLRHMVAELEALGCAIQLGGHDLGRIARASAVVVSPGVAPSAPAYRAAQQANVPIVAELDLAARCLAATRLIVTTGTKGKSTTAALIARLLDATGLGPGRAAGNIGLPLADVALQDPAPAWLAVEASSFQLHDSPALRPAVGVLTNLSPDHLDRYQDVGAYYADKGLLFRNADAGSRWVTNGDDAEVVRLASDRPGTHEHFSIERRHAHAWYDRTAGWLVLRGMPLARRRDLPLLGDHNVANALAAALALPPDVDREAVAAAMREFRALPHRLEPVREVDGVLWVNDSKATTVSAALSAVLAMERPVVLLLGGRDKGGDFGALAPALRGHRAVVAYGEAGERVERELAGKVVVVREGRDFAVVVERARQLAQPGDAVLLAPACSSFDMFSSAEERGQAFRELVEQLAGSLGPTGTTSPGG
jgi:UDP-N-acetylmuramoylalanine--D-glutamate ligase